MMVTCPIHGLSFGLHASPDFKMQVEKEKSIDNLVKIEFVLEDEIVFDAYLSLVFAQKHGLSSSQTLPLPNEFPIWVEQLLPLCEECFKAAT